LRTRACWIPSATIDINGVEVIARDLSRERKVTKQMQALAV
jgi:hypothetical protein